MANYFIRILIALDMVLQACLHCGVIGITISSRAYTAKVHGHRWGILLVGFLDLFEKDHCRKSLEADRARAQAVLDSLKEF